MDTNVSQISGAEIQFLLTTKRDIMMLALILSPLRDNIQDGIEMEVHALIYSGIGYSSTFLDQITSLPKSVHFNAKLQRKFKNNNKTSMGKTSLSNLVKNI